MLCAKCNQDNPADASFCEGCGSKLELACPACKASLSPGARFCKKCGTAIGSTKADASATGSSTKSEIRVAADAGASEAVEGERKTVTALFADIKGSMELMEDLDPEEARAIVNPAGPRQRSMRRCFAAGGTPKPSSGITFRQNSGGFNSPLMRQQLVIAGRHDEVEPPDGRAQSSCRERDRQQDPRTDVRTGFCQVAVLDRDDEL